MDYLDLFIGTLACSGGIIAMAISRFLRRHQECAQQMKSPSPGQIGAESIAVGSLSATLFPRRHGFIPGKQPTRIRLSTSLFPQTLRRLCFPEARLHDASHDVVGIFGTGPVVRRAGVGGSLPLCPAYVLVETDAVSAPVVGATAADAAYLYRCGICCQGTTGASS
jgi:hypothetical protein